MTYRFKSNEMVLTKVKDFTEFKHFSSTSQHDTTLT